MRKLLAYINILYNWKISKNILLNYVPEDISIELTNICNFKCHFCPQSDLNHFNVVSRTTLSSDHANILISKLREGGVKTNVIHWTLDGEPFINKNIYEICSIAINKGFNIIIFSTNGYYCTPDRLDKLPTNNHEVNYNLCIDFCYNKELFEKIRGTPKSWERIKSNILQILDGNQYKHIHVTITDISSFQINGNDVLRNNILLLKGIFGKSERLTIGSRIFHNVTGFIPGIREQKKEKSNKYNLCPYPWTSMVIASNGDVVACCRDLEHKTVLGNLFTEDLVSIWNGEKYQNLRKALLDRKPEVIKACKNCDLPYDKGKFSIRHILKMGINRLGIFK